MSQKRISEYRNPNFILCIKNNGEKIELIYIKLSCNTCYYTLITKEQLESYGIDGVDNFYSFIEHVIEPNAVPGHSYSLCKTIMSSYIENNGIALTFYFKNIISKTIIINLYPKTYVTEQKLTEDLPKESSEVLPKKSSEVLPSDTSEKYLQLINKLTERLDNQEKKTIELEIKNNELKENYTELKENYTMLKENHTMLKEKYYALETFVDNNDLKKINGLMIYSGLDNGTNPIMIKYVIDKLNIRVGNYENNIVGVIDPILYLSNSVFSCPSLLMV